MDSDSKLVEKAKTGDKNAFAKLVKKYRKPILNLAYDYLGDFEEAKDVAQEVFIKASTSLGLFHGRSAFATWLYRIAVNTCLDAKRRANTRPVLAQEDEIGEDGFDLQPDQDRTSSPAFLVESNEVQARLNRALGKLSENQRAVVTMRYLQGLSTKEAAEVLNCDTNTVRTHLFRAFDKLKTLLDDMKDDHYEM